MSELKAVRKSKAATIKLDGVERELKFTLNAMAELEELYGDPQLAFTKLDEGSFTAIRAVLWAGLLWKEPDLTLTQVGNMLSLNDMQDMMEELGEALADDLPEPSQQAIQAAKLEAAQEQDPNIQAPVVKVVPLKPVSNSDGTGHS